MARPADSDTPASEIARLRRSVEELSVLNELARDIGATLDLDRIMTKVIRRAARAIGADQAVITLVDREDRVTGGTVVRTQADSGETHFHLHHGLLGMMYVERRPVIVNSPRDDPRLFGLKLQDGITNVACAPLLVGDELIGVLAAYNKHDKSDFDDDDMRLLAIIGAQSAQVIERARLAKEEEDARQLREAILMAARMQESLLPAAPPVTPGYDIFGTTRAAWEVGGDYFDYIKLDDNRWGLALGDVSGKGPAAALLMANLQATLRGEALRDQDCATCITWCNRLLYRSTTPEKFATLFYCVLDTREHRICYCNAGHEHPLLLTAAGEVRTLADIGGIPIGMIEDVSYDLGRAELAPGELLVIYSDGVTDMANSVDEPFGTGALVATIRDHARAPAADIAAAVVAAVRRHAEGEPPFDDVTIMVVKRDPA